MITWKIRYEYQQEHTYMSCNAPV